MPMRYTLFVWFVKITAYIAQKVVFRTKIYYKNRKVQGRRCKGAAILASNHTAVWDFAAWMFTFATNTPRCLMAEILFRKNPLLTFFLRSVGGIEANRETFDFRFLSEAEKIISDGGVVEIFPEARIPLPGEKRPLPFKPSAAYIALRTNAPIIPLYTDGNYFSLKRNRVIIGEPIYVVDVIDESLTEKENIEKLTQHLRDVIMELEYELKEKIKA